MKIFSSLWAQMRAQGFVVSPEQVKLSGDYNRFPRDTNGLNGWLRVDYDENLNFARAEYGDWRTGEKYAWDSRSETPASPERDEEIQEFLAKRHEENEKKRVQGYAEAKSRAKEMWDSFSEGFVSPYLVRKMKSFGGQGEPYDATHGTRSTAGGDTYVPAYGWSEQGLELRGLQKIQADGGKYFQPGMEIKGSFSWLPGLEGREITRVFVAEGLATAASVWEALGKTYPVAACFNAGNMKAVVGAMRDRFPSAELVACGDEDLFTKVRGRYQNTGRLAAEGSGADAVVFPDFAHVFAENSEVFREIKPSDFNDLSFACETSAMEKSILEQVSGKLVPEPAALRGGPLPDAPPTPGANGGDEPIPGPAGEGEEERDPYPGRFPEPKGKPGPESPGGPLPRRNGEDGKPKKPTQQRVARALADFHGLNLIKCSGEIFSWRGTHWGLCEGPEHDRFFQQAMALAGSDFKAGEISSVLEIFQKHIPHAPEGVNLFEARSDRANFNNGTLHLSFQAKTPQEMAQNPGDGTHWLKSDFRAHAREDFCNSVIPLEYRPHAELPENLEFTKMMGDLWPGEESAVKIRLYKQVLGSALLPMFPKIFFFIGVPGTGKSTALMMIRKLLAEQNIASVDPTKWGKEFYLEPMAGKLANIHLDIDTKRRLDDSVLKNVIDRAVFQINRKGRTIVKAMLPAFHAFGANDMPPSLDANSGAFNRRMILVKTDAVQPGSGGGGEFSAWVWGRGPEGVLKAALEGLEDLLKHGGQFSEPESSKQEKKEWGHESDHIGQFIEACRTGEFRAANNVRVNVDKDSRIMSSDLYQIYAEWCKREGLSTTLRGAAVFGRMLSKRNVFKRHILKTGTEWLGIGLGGGKGPGAGDLPPELPPRQDHDNTPQF